MLLGRFGLTTKLTEWGKTKQRAACYVLRRRNRERSERCPVNAATEYVALFLLRVCWRQRTKAVFVAVVRSMVGRRLSHVPLDHRGGRINEPSPLALYRPFKMVGKPFQADIFHCLIGLA